MQNNHAMKSLSILFPKILCLLIIIFSCPSTMAQEPESDSDEQEAKYRPVEITTSGVYSYGLQDEEGLMALEIHPCYWFKNSDWGIGFSYTGKFAVEGLLSDLNLLGSYEAAKWATINAGLALGLPFEEVREELTVGLYAEVEWNIELSERFHIGILTGTVLGCTQELTTGIQAGLKF